MPSCLPLSLQRAPPWTEPALRPSRGPLPLGAASCREVISVWGHPDPNGKEGSVGGGHGTSCQVQGVRLRACDRRRGSGLSTR